MSLRAEATTTSEPANSRTGGRTTWTAFTVTPLSAPATGVCSLRITFPPPGRLTTVLGAGEACALTITVGPTWRKSMTAFDPVAPEHALLDSATTFDMV